MKKSTEQQVVALFVQAMRTALAMIDEKEEAPAAAPKAARSRPKHIYPAKSKYNPWRAYVWTGGKDGKTVYLGQFPTIARAQAAQKAYYAGRPLKDGTRVANNRPPPALELVRQSKKAA